MKRVPIYFSLKEFDRIVEISKNYTSKFILVDTNTYKECFPLLQPYLNEINYHVIEVGAGEINKSVSTCEFIWEQLLNAKADRHSLLINLGGGLICDMGGFVAATFKRGIDFINMPTTLLGMADAAIGNKTGVNFGNIKNQVGLFASPLAVFIYSGFLRTLDERQVKSGFAEVLKHAIIYDKDYWNELKNLNPLETNDDHLKKSLEIKQEITLQDPEEKNVRKKLNFGHTIGHALESISIEKGLNQLFHGEAIAAGMICEAFLSRKVGLLQSELDELTAVLNKIYNPVLISENEFEQLWEFISYDKKKVGNNTSFTLLTTIGEASFDNNCSKEEVFDALNHYLQSSVQHQLQ